MNQYGLPLVAPSTQTILPAITEDGLVKGWYPIAQTTFDGTETEFTLSDMTVPLKTVTVDSGNGIPQYMAAVWPKGLPFNEYPWASADLVAAGEGNYRWWTSPTETWFLYFGAGALIEGLQWGLDQSSAVAPTPPTPPDADDGALTWKASVEYLSLYGPCPFFDFNWVTLFQASSPTKTPLRIQILTTPASIAPATVPPLRAAVTGNPQLTSEGPLYNNIRIMKLGEEVPVGDYVWTFRIFDDQNQTKDVTFTLTVK